MPCAAYQDPRLAALYDALNPPAADWRFHLSLATDAPLRVLDVGCGTGALAVRFAELGHHATYESRFRFPGEEPVVAVDRLRFVGAADLDRRLQATGFEEVHMYGDWDRSPLTPNSPEIVVVAGGDGAAS